MSKFLLSVDNGLTTTKSVIFTLDGKEVASSLVTTVVESRGEYSEIDMELQWKNTATVIKESILKSGVDPKNIIGVGNSGHGAGLYFLNELNKPYRRAITSMDSRSNKILQEWRNQGKGSYDRLYQNFWSGQAIPILYWLKNNEPDSYESINKILMVKDWIIYMLTGEIGIEYTDASNSGLINPTSKEIDTELLDRFELREFFNKIPKIRKTTDIAGYISKKAAMETGLTEGTPVMGGVFDCIACAIGSGTYEEDRYSLIAGTWNVNCGVEKKLMSKSQTIKCSLYADTDRYFYVESSATSAVNLEWFIDNVIKGFMPLPISNDEMYKMIDCQIEKIRPEKSYVVYMPFLYKSHLSKNLDGCFWGMKPEYNIYHLLRAIYEGVTFAHMKHVENLRKSGIHRNKAVLSGGASNSSVWCQMFADVLNIEVATTEVSQVGALGTAICTAIALGEYINFKEAINIMVHSKKCYYPQVINNEIYMEKYNEFNKIIKKFDR